MANRLNLNNRSTNIPVGYDIALYRPIINVYFAQGMQIPGPEPDNPKMYRWAKELRYSFGQNDGFKIEIKIFEDRCNAIPQWVETLKDLMTKGNNVMSCEFGWIARNTDTMEKKRAKDIMEEEKYGSDIYKPSNSYNDNVIKQQLSRKIMALITDLQIAYTEGGYEISISAQDPLSYTNKINTLELSGGPKNFKEMIDSLLEFLKKQNELFAKNIIIAKYSKEFDENFKTTDKITNWGINGKDVLTAIHDCVKKIQTIGRGNQRLAQRAERKRSARRRTAMTPKLKSATLKCYWDNSEEKYVLLFDIAKNNNVLFPKNKPIHVNMGKVPPASGTEAQSFSPSLNMLKNITPLPQESSADHQSRRVVTSNDSNAEGQVMNQPGASVDSTKTTEQVQESSVEYHSEVIKLKPGAVNAVQTEIQIMGDTTLDMYLNPNLLGSEVNVVVWNPWRINVRRNELNFDNSWIRDPITDPFFDNSSFILTGVEHYVSSGAYNTTLKLFSKQMLESEEE